MSDLMKSSKSYHYGLATGVSDGTMAGLAGAEERKREQAKQRKQQAEWAASRRQTDKRRSPSSSGGASKIFIIGGLLFVGYLAMSGVSAVKIDAVIKIGGGIFLLGLVLAFWRKIVLGAGLIAAILIIGAILK